MNEREQVIQSLRDAANFLERHPDVPTPVYNSLTVFVDTKEKITAIARAAAWEKIYAGDWFSLRKTFSEHFNFNVFVDRATVCRRVVKGTKVLPAQPEQVVEEVDWICDEPLLAAGAPNGKA